MHCFIILSCLFSVTLGTIPFKWNDCSPDKTTQAIQVTSITAGPVPLVHPGPLHLSFSGKVLKPIPVFLLEFQFQKKLLFGHLTIPCVGGIGSCSSDGCSYVDSLLNSTRSSAQSIGKQILNMVASVNSTLKCPIPAESIDVKDYTINVPDLGAVASVIADGDYTVKITTKVPGTSEILGCLSLDVSLKRKCSGLGCVFGRR